MNKSLVFSIIFLLGSLSVCFAQNKKSPKAEAENKVGNVDVKINYSSPAVRGRTVYGDLVPYGEVWRTGADNATTIEFSGPVTINDKPLAAGKYALFTIPGEKEWTIIFNKNPDQWGAYKYDKALDALRINVSPKTATPTENLKLDINQAGVVGIQWERVRAEFQVKQSKPGN